MQTETVPSIYTSYFSKLSKLDREHYTAINIAGKQPNGIELPTCKFLVPPKSLVFAYKDGDIPWAKYVKDYNDLLDKNTIESVIEDIAKLANGKTPVLFCYEKPEANCHRHLAAWWIMSQTEFLVKELSL